MANPSYDLDLQILTRVNPKAVSITLWDNTGVGTEFPYGWQPEDGGAPLANPKKSNTTLGSYVISYPGDGLSAAGNFTSDQLAAYLDNTQGVTLLASDLFGSAYPNFPDGIPEIMITLVGTHIAAAVQAWSTYVKKKEAFITFLQNIIRTWVLEIPVPTKDLNSVFDPVMANLILDSIYYNVQFGQYEDAQASIDFLTEISQAGKNITDYINEQNL